MPFGAANPRGEPECRLGKNKPRCRSRPPAPGVGTLTGCPHRGVEVPPDADLVGSHSGHRVAQGTDSTQTRRLIFQVPRVRRPGTGRPRLAGAQPGPGRCCRFRPGGPRVTDSPLPAEGPGEVRAQLPPRTTFRSGAPAFCPSKRVFSPDASPPLPPLPPLLAHLQPENPGATRSPGPHPGARTAQCIPPGAQGKGPSLPALGRLPRRPQSALRGPGPGARFRGAPAGAGAGGRLGPDAPLSPQGRRRATGRSRARGTAPRCA